MVDPEWQGGKKEQRLYRKVRAEKQKVIRKKYDVIQGRRELEGKSPGKPGEGVLTGGRQRRAGGGRKPAVERQPGLVEAIEMTCPHERVHPLS